MSTIYKIFIFLLVISATACVSDYSNISTASGEDEDVGLGGTGLLANTGSGLGGTGIIGEITGFGSIFVNGIEIEYDNKTPFSIDGNKATYQHLKVGDVVEVLTTNSSNHTQAQKINLRHEVIGKVESVNAETFSYIVQGQTIFQKKNTGTLPEVGATVAISGMRINDQTIMSTRTTVTDTEQKLLRINTELPFKEQAARWSIQMHIKNGQAEIQLDGNKKILSINKTTADSLKAASAIKILELHKTATGQLKLDNVLSPLAIPLGQSSPTHKMKTDNRRIQRPSRTKPRTTRGIR